MVDAGGWEATNLFRRDDGDGIFGRDGDVVRPGVLLALDAPAELRTKD